MNPGNPAGLRRSNMKFSKARNTALAVAGAAAVLAGNASAAIDTTSVTAAITEGQTAAVAVAIAFGVAVWAVRTVKMIRRA